MIARPIKVLVVDDSAIVRKLIADAIRREPDMRVVGTAADPFVARDLLLQREPDVMTLDVEMPRMDGLNFLRRIMTHRPMPVIIVSSVTPRGSAASLEALRLGAVDVIAKPGGPSALAGVVAAITDRIRALKTTPAEIRRVVAPPADVPPAGAALSARGRMGLFLIGASTGGTQAIETVLTRLPADTPPILVVQHMPPVFTRAFAERLDTVCPMKVVEASGGETLKPGVAYIAPGDRHLVVEQQGVTLVTALRDGPPVHYQRPSVDVLFHSAARLKSVPMVAALLTGMGQDGADGLLALRRAGAETLAEDERSCVVFGMPKEAIARGAASQVVTLLHMPGTMIASLERMAGARELA